MAERIRVVIADDHPVVRRGLRGILEESDALEVVGEAADGEAALELIERLVPHVAVLDVDMPKRDGFGVAREVIRRKLSTKLIFMTLHNDGELFRAATELGVHGYLLKDSAMLEIVAGVSAVAAGRPYFSSEVTMRMLQAREPAEPRVEDVTSRLTPSERRIMQLIAEGQSSKEIGAALQIHYRTVENHRTNICRKLGLEGANALVRFALQNKSKL
jgi:DNA-binding NarL/FixJ family response regulator